VAGGDSVSRRREKFEEDKDEDEQNFGNSKSFVPAFWQFSSLV